MVSDSVSIVFLFLATLTTTSESAPRTWTDSTGEFSVEAELVGVENGAVRLKKADGNEIAVPLDRLSESDRAFVTQNILPISKPRQQTGPSANSTAEILWQDEFDLTSLPRYSTETPSRPQNWDVSGGVLRHRTLKKPVINDVLLLPVKPTGDLVVEYDVIPSAADAHDANLRLGDFSILVGGYENTKCMMKRNFPDGRRVDGFWAFDALPTDKPSHVDVVRIGKWIWVAVNERVVIATTLWQIKPEEPCHIGMEGGFMAPSIAIDNLVVRRPTRDEYKAVNVSPPKQTSPDVARQTAEVHSVASLLTKNVVGTSQLPPDPKRVSEIAAMLPRKPRGVGRPIDDREAWEDLKSKLVSSGEYATLIDEAEELLNSPIPELPDELYLEFSRNGNRVNYQEVQSRLHQRVDTLTLAECIENRGRFLSALEDVIRAVCAERTWVLPAHDHGLNNFHGRVQQIDLIVARISWQLSLTDYWVGDRLKPQVRQLIRTELERRTFRPFEESLRTGQSKAGWLTATHNWNAVCLAGVTGAALAVIEEPERRAVFAAAAEKLSKNYLRGFAADGYCSEGLGYWNYGFSRYVALAETLMQATDGQVDLFKGAKVGQIARFGQAIEIGSGIYPAIADCGLGAKPDPFLMGYLSRRYQLGLTEIVRVSSDLSDGFPGVLHLLAIFGFPNSASHTASSKPKGFAPRDWFADAGILICRPGSSKACRLAVALKGGHNGEHHNHNDVGTFIVVCGDETPLVDPGGEVYTSRTFSGRRYQSGVLSSFGHPVPRVAGKLQRTGRQAAAKVVSKEFTDSQDTLVLDLRAAYDVKPLESLQRTFVYSRAGDWRSARKRDPPPRGIIGV